MVETSSKHENKTEAEKRVEKEREGGRERKKQKRIETYQNFRYALDPGPLHRGKKRGGIVPGIHHEEAHDSPCIMQ